MDEERLIEMTKEGFRKLRDELALLEGERARIIEAIATARAHGDLSENAEYHAAKDEQGHQEARIRQLRHMIEHARVVEAADDGIVRAGMVVTIRRDGGEPETYLLGLREQKGGDHDILTPESPLGRSVIGRSAGDVVSAAVPSGEIKVEIVAVRAP